ncbi:DNA-directed RNA polymerase subunit E'' [Candidatus Woesearchaeota archaeon]|nr:DNA-directed RNA polymerase subunit E'' [Candidatus Woesearchaeota archaeon]
MRKVCRKCKIFVKGEECSLCKGKEFSENWQGRITILDANSSEVAKKIGINAKGEYVIKAR